MDGRLRDGVGVSVGVNMWRLLRLLRPKGVGLSASINIFVYVSNHIRVLSSCDIMPNYSNTER